MTFSEWMRNNLLNSWEGLITQDIDYIVFDSKLNSFLLLEEKNNFHAPINIGQAIIFKFLDEFLNLQKICTYNGSFLVYVTETKSNSAIYINPPIKKDDNMRRYIADINNNNNVKNINLENFLEYLCDNQNNLKQSFYRNWWNYIINTQINNLYDCKGEPPKFHTRGERSHYRGFKLQNLCKNIKNINWIFVNYCTGYFILIEEKTNSNGQYTPSEEECQLIDIINKIFEESDRKNKNLPNNNKIKNPRSNAIYEYLGYFLIEFDNSTPDNSKSIWLNHEPIDKKDLITFLNLNTDSLSIANSYRNQWW